MNTTSGTINKISDALNRLATYITEFEKSKDFNEARKAAEAMCRILLLNSDNQAIRDKAEQTKLNLLIESLTSESLGIDQNHLKKIKLDLNGIQVFGNILSHDNSYIFTDEDTSRVEVLFEQLLKNIFDSKDIVNIDQKLPLEIYQKIHKLILGDEDWRCEKIISIVYPNRARLNTIKEKDYEFYVLKDADQRKIGLLFLGRNICFSQTLESVFSLEEIKGLSTLTILFPLEISKTTGSPVKNRKEYLEKLSKRIFGRSNAIALSHEFIEDYIWDRCLSNSEKRVDIFSGEPYFIDQKLHTPQKSLLSLDFVDSIIKNNIQEKKPIYIIFGDGGAGKTTFCEQAVDKINTYQGKGLKKKAILLSSFDIPDELSGKNLKVDSLESLYALAMNGDENSIHPSNLTLNISSGNLLIIIDGLDEIQSKLKERFYLDEFIDSVSNLNDTYLNCSVLITSREINKASFERKDVYILNIKGFDEQLIQQYLEKRFKKDHTAIYRARQYLSEVSQENEVTPLIIRLICELATEDIGNKKFSGINGKYFQESEVLDKVIFQLIEREVGKQVLPVTCDQYVDILKDMVFEYGGRVKKDEFDLLIEVALSDTPSQPKSRDLKNFHLSTLLCKDGDLFKIKYDSLEMWIKARYLTHLLNEKTEENDSNVLKIFSQNCYKGGVLVNEISRFKNDTFTYESNVIRKAVSNLQPDLEDTHTRKLISALLYIAFDKKTLDRTERSNLILEIFNEKNGGKIKGLSIYGDFYALDFSFFTVSLGYFNDFSNLLKSNIPSGVKTFFSSQFLGIETAYFKKGTISGENFDSDCHICQELLEVIESDAENKEKKQSNIKSDLGKIFRVGFKAGGFTWKSESLYKQQCGTLKSKIGLTSFLSSLEREGFLEKINTTGASGDGYTVRDNLKLDVKDFLTQSIVSNKVQALLEKLTSL